MELFYKTHKYLVEHVTSPVERELMQEIDWSHRLIGIKGSRGVGKTTFLLQYAKEHFGTDSSCLYINLNHLCFAERTLSEFAKEFAASGGRTLLIDQVFKYPNWSEELRYCHDNIPGLNIVFTGSSVMRLKDDNPYLAGIVKSYNLRGFSFREYLNLMAGTKFKFVKLEDLLLSHKEIAKKVTEIINPYDYFSAYQHHGFYPFFLEKRNFSENLIKTMNMIMEVDILLIKQIELTYLAKIRRLLYMLVKDAPCVPNISKLSKEIQTSRATIVNYIKYLSDARLINVLYQAGESFPKKPARVYMHNTNLMYATGPENIDQQAVRETFLYNNLYKDNIVNKGDKGGQFLVNGKYRFKVDSCKPRNNREEFIYAVDNIKAGEGNVIPLWLFGFLY
ncbi:MAG: AAA family ATPase [Bacteroidales bacterium]